MHARGPAIPPAAFPAGLPYAFGIPPMVQPGPYYQPPHPAALPPAIAPASTSATRDRAGTKPRRSLLEELEDTGSESSDDELEDVPLAWTSSSSQKRPRSNTQGSEVLTPKKVRSDPPKGRATPKPAAAPDVKASAEALIDVLGVSGWSLADKKALYDYVLGQEHQDNWERYKVDRNRVFRNVRHFISARFCNSYCIQAASELFHDRHSESAVRGFWHRSMQTYIAILAFEGFTGGGGDGDLSTKERIELARKEGKNVGSLHAKLYAEWKDNGWVDLFASR